jgi:endonuclease/exonuclease/phosphatase family metal-dependent hydrolase
MQRQLFRNDADVLCLQEVRAQPDAAGDTHLSALDKLLATTQCATHQRVVGAKADGMPNRERNVLTLSRFNIQEIDDATGFRPRWYQMSQAVPPATARSTSSGSARSCTAGRAIGQPGLHVINLHLKSKLRRASRFPDNGLRAEFCSVVSRQVVEIALRHPRS